MPELETAKAPDRHCLLIDQGNSRVKWIGAVWHAMSGNWGLDVTTFGEGGPQDLGAALDSGALMPPEEILLCSVAADDSVAALEDAIATRSRAGLVRMRAGPETRGIRNGYREPSQLGADRWMAVVGAARRYGLPVVVMDLGTASTLDAVDDEGRHLGGLILPGPRAMLDALKGGTALDIDPASALGADCATGVAGAAHDETAAAIEGGVVAAQVGALERFVDWFEQQLGDNSPALLKIVVTGGGAGAILHQVIGQSIGQPGGHSGYQLTHDPLLVFRGMLLCRYGCADNPIKDPGKDQDNHSREER